MALQDLKEEEQSEPDSEESDVIDVDGEEVDSRPVPQSENSLIQPVSDISDVVSLYDRFEEIKSELLDKEDTTSIQGNVHVNKSGWRKIATAFNLSVEIVDHEIWVEDGIVKARVVARATAPNGKVSTEIGMCASNEANSMTRLEGNAEVSKDQVSEKYGGFDEEDILLVDSAWRGLHDPREVNEHNILATAATRAKNRAISDCVGGGEVSAEEITKEDVFG